MVLGRDSIGKVMGLSLPLEFRQNSVDLVAIESAKCCIGTFGGDLAPKVAKVCLLGVLEPKLLEMFLRFSGEKPYGCALTAQEKESIPTKFHPRLKVAEPLAFLAAMRHKGIIFDLIFPTIFTRLESACIGEILVACSYVTTYMYFDPIGLGLASRMQLDRWQYQLEHAGFEECLNMWGGRSSLWRSVRLG